jgi:hypothetical protein
MTIAELIYEQVRALPDSLAREVLDFIGYLREHRDREGWRDLRDAKRTSSRTSEITPMIESGMMSQLQPELTVRA